MRWAFLRDAYEPSSLHLGQVVSWQFRLHRVIAIHGNEITFQRLTRWERIQYRREAKRREHERESLHG